MPCVRARVLMQNLNFGGAQWLCRFYRTLCRAKISRKNTPSRNTLILTSSSHTRSEREILTTYMYLPMHDNIYSGGKSSRSTVVFAQLTGMHVKSGPGERFLTRIRAKIPGPSENFPDRSEKSLFPGNQNFFHFPALWSRHPPAADETMQTASPRARLSATGTLIVILR